MSSIDVDKTEQITICFEDVFGSILMFLFYGLERSRYFPQLELIDNLSPVFDSAFLRPRSLHRVRSNSKTILLMTTDKWQVVAALKDAD